MTEDPWADVPSGDYWKPDEVGARITGTVVRREHGLDVNGKPCPQLVIDTGDGGLKTVTCSQANLKAQMRALTPRPEPGDKIQITYTGTRKAALGDAKIFEIKHKVGEPVAAEEIF